MQFNIETFLTVLNSKGNNHLLELDTRLGKCAAPYISECLAQIITKFVLHGRVHKYRLEKSQCSVCEKHKRILII